jgi:hypothetical protein
MERTVLSGVANTEFPHAFAAREEMRSWHLLQLNPVMLRQPSSMVGPQVMSIDGEYLPGVLARLQAEYPFILADISRDLANLIPGIIKIEVEPDKLNDEFVIWATTEDGRRFSSRVLSDGTLRMLALTVLKNDLQHHGVVLFEEPENGVHPRRLKNIAHIINDLASDFDDIEQGDVLLRQFLCNTHSPLFIRQPSILPHVLFAYTVSHIDPRHPEKPERITRMAPVISADLQADIPFDISNEEVSYTLAEVTAFLENVDLGESRSLLDAAVVNKKGEITR